MFRRACAVLNPRCPASSRSHLAPVPRREISGKLSEVVGSVRKAVGNFRKAVGNFPSCIARWVMSSHHALRTGNKSLVIPRPPVEPPHQGRHYRLFPVRHVRTSYSVPGVAILRTDTQPRGRYMTSLHDGPETAYSDGLYYSQTDTSRSLL